MSDPVQSSAPSKSCGDCGMCCKVLHISEISKPAGQWCGVFRKGSGCGDYEARPQACRASTACG
jgi:Fe-S-cluster containining protein